MFTKSTVCGVLDVFFLARDLWLIFMATVNSDSITFGLIYVIPVNVVCQLSLGVRAVHGKLLDLVFVYK